MNKLLFLVFAALSLYGCNRPEARRPVSQAGGSYILQSAERNKALYAQEKQYLQELVAQDSLLEFQSSPNGFWYAIIDQDSTQNIKPQLGDLVRFSFDIRSLNGDTLISRNKNGILEYRIDQSNQDLISGLREGLKVMSPGDMTEFLFPSYLAYGYYGSQGEVEPNQMVRSKVELYSINENSTNN